MALDLDVALQTVRQSLPARTCWLIDGEPLRHSFGEPLIPLRELVADARLFQDEWEPLMVFGTDDYANGGGASASIVLHRDTGEVFRIDLEREPEQVLLCNSSLGRYIATFTYLDGYLASNQSLPTDLAQIIKSLDEPAYARSAWRGLVEHLRDPVLVVQTKKRSEI